jgi:hypothetical protein
MPSLADLQIAQNEVFATMRILATSPEGTVQNLGGRGYTQKDMRELQTQYDWLGTKIASAARAAGNAGGGAGVVEFGGPSQ